MPSLIKYVALGVLSSVSFAAAQDGYTGYNLTVDGDPDSTIYATDNGATSNTSLTDPPPDVFLDASVHVGEIDIEVDNITASINLEAQVLDLLQFNAGVDVSIDRVALTIQNVSAHVILEARLENLVVMISDVLDSVDLNPVIASLATGVGEVINQTTGILTGDEQSAIQARSLALEENILYSVNDYSGNAHTNRILSKNGNVVDLDLHNDGSAYGHRLVGTYLSLMTFTGHDVQVTKNGQQLREREFSYAPFPGLIALSAIYTDSTGKVVDAEVIAETRAGGTSSISEESSEEEVSA